MLKRHWIDNTTVDFEGVDPERAIAILPVAAVEQHGPHLPVGTDTLINEGMIAEALRRMPEDLEASFLPVQTVGKSNEHISSVGTLTLDWETVTKAWLDIGNSVARAGVRKLLLINSHGGNVPMIDIVTRELRVRHDMLAVGTAWSRFGYPEGVFPPEEFVYGIHGGDYETSVMLHFRPDLVRMELAEDFRSATHDFIEDFTHLRAHGPAQFGWKAQDLNTAGVVGNAVAATADKGAKAVAHQVGGFLALLDDMRRFRLERLWKPCA